MGESKQYRTEMRNKRLFKTAARREISSSIEEYNFRRLVQTGTIVRHRKVEIDEQ